MANKSNKTAICPYSVTKDIKDTSTDIPVAGQRIYIVNQGWCTGDGTTTLADLSIETVGTNGEVDLSNYYTKTESDDMLNSVFQGMDTRDEINLGLAKQYTNNSITEATNQLEPFFASITTNKDDLYVNCGYHGIMNAYSMNKCIYLKYNSKIYHLAALVNSEFIFFDYEGSTITVGMDTDAYDYVIVNEQTGFESALDDRIISSDIISDNPYEEGLISEENYESLSEFNTFSSLSTMAIYDFLQGQINNDCVNLGLLEDTKTEINEALDNKVGVDNFENYGYTRIDAENTFQSKDYIIYGYNIDGVYGIDDTYENIAEAYGSGKNVYLIISEHEDIPYSVKLSLTKDSVISSEFIFESACGIIVTINSDNVVTFDNTNLFIKQKVFDDTINTLTQRIETAETKTISGSIVTINNTEESTPLSVNLTSDTVTDFSNVTVYETGKNLFDINSWVEESSTKYLSLVRQTENGIVINSSRTVDSAICWYMFLPAGTYTFSLNKLRTNSIYVSDTIDGEYTLKANVKPADGELTKTITFSEPKYIKYVTYCNPGVETTLEYLQIELGEVATEFEPYKGISFTPEASGKVSNMVSLGPTTIIYTNSIDTVVNVSYEAKESTIEIVDNLESTDDKKALSANQGRILNEKIDECKQSITKISKMSGAKMAIIGDSISHGVGSMILSNGTAVPTSGTNMLTYKNQAWWQLVRDRYGIDDSVLNNSQTGASFTIDGSSKDDEGNIINRRFTTYLNTDDLPEDLDIIMVFGGTNDWSQSKALGTIDDEPSTENNATFYAAVKSVLDYLTINFPDAQLVFVTPLQRYRDNTFNAKNTQNLYMKDYVDAIKTLCAVYGVQVVDLYSNSKFHMNSEEFRNTYVPDGTHPNAEGTERYVKNGIFPTLDQLWMDYKV